MFHKTATVAVTGLLAVAATLAVASGVADAAPEQSSPNGTALAQQADPADGTGSSDSEGGGGGKGGKGKEGKEGGGGKGGKGKGQGGKPADEPTSADTDAAAALNSLLRNFLRPPNGGAEMGPGGKTSDEWLDLFLGPQPSPDGSVPKAKPIR
ncbi:hypothetical protein ACQPW1_08570 [Nocardia sp. CA-128927]|uniref:hypothetical protein n=1 Tax=Nocardia sp. CA-128927 TaxID=3239975 RepID=UPI003D96F30A